MFDSQLMMRSPHKAKPETRAASNSVLRLAMGKRFIEAREINGWGQLEAATKLGYTNSTQLSLIEQGKRMPPVEVISRAATAYGVAVDYLFSLSDEPERDPKQAEKRAAIRHVHDLLETNAAVIVEAMMSTIATGSPSVVATRSLVEAANKQIDSLKRFKALNEEAFDDMPGGNTVMVSMAALESLVQNITQVLSRHDHFVEKAAIEAKRTREIQSHERAMRRQREAQRGQNAMSTAPDQYHLTLGESFESVRTQ